MKHQKHEFTGDELGQSNVYVTQRISRPHPLFSINIYWNDSRNEIEKIQDVFILQYDTTRELLFNKTQRFICLHRCI